MEQQINIEQIMEEIRAEAKAQPPYEPAAEFVPQEFSSAKKAQLGMLRTGAAVWQRVKAAGKALARLAMRVLRKLKRCVTKLRRGQ